MKQTKQNKEQAKLRESFLNKGVKMISPETIFFSKDTEIGNNVTIEPYVVIGEKVTIGNDVKIYSFSHIENSKIEKIIGFNIIENKKNIGIVMDYHTSKQLILFCRIQIYLFSCI